MATRMKFKIEDRDKGFKKLLRRLVPRAPSVTVGVYGDGKKYPDGTSLLEVATIHEFGAPAANIPKRSFLIDTANKNERKISRNLALSAERVASGKATHHQALALFGVWFEGVVKARIAAGISPANKPLTIKRKGSSKPLIDTGQLRNSITHEVNG